MPPPLLELNAPPARPPVIVLFDRLRLGRSSASLAPLKIAPPCPRRGLDVFVEGTARLALNVEPVMVAVPALNTAPPLPVAPCTFPTAELLLTVTPLSVRSPAAVVVLTRPTTYTPPPAPLSAPVAVATLPVIDPPVMDSDAPCATKAPAPSAALLLVRLTLVATTLPPPMASPPPKPVVGLPRVKVRSLSVRVAAAGSVVPSAYWVFVPSKTVVAA